MTLKDLFSQAMLRKVLLLISALTIVSGLVQMLAPSFVLGLIGGEVSPSGNHSFGIVGMFMILFGGLLLQALFAEEPQPIVLLWCGLQKFGAAAAVTLGVMRDVFSWLALGVAGFDLVSGVAILFYRFFWYIMNRINAGSK